MVGYRVKFLRFTFQSYIGVILCCSNLLFIRLSDFWHTICAHVIVLFLLFLIFPVMGFYLIKVGFPFLRCIHSSALPVTVEKNLTMDVCLPVSIPRVLFCYHYYLYLRNIFWFLPETVPVSLPIIFYSRHSKCSYFSVYLTLSLLMYIYGAPCKARNFNVVYTWTYVWQRWKSSLSICCTMFQRWIYAESCTVAHMCANTLLATKITLITNGI
jgi:hypothetical protein